MNEMEKNIQILLDTYKKAVEDKDIDQLLSIYDPDVVVFDMWGNWEYQGLEAWKTTVKEWFESLGNDKIIVVIQDVQIIPDKITAGVHAYLTFSAVSDTGDILHSMDNRFSWILKNQRGSWKIQHEHSSAPIDYESNKVILKRSSFPGR
jgi:uncharacterized protein (TIGR02246 family)